jgi:hypothetical protein
MLLTQMEVCILSRVIFTQRGKVETENLPLTKFISGQVLDEFPSQTEIRPLI